MKYSEDIMNDYEKKLFECQTVNEIQVVVEEEYNGVCHLCEGLWSGMKGICQNINLVDDDEYDDIYQLGKSLAVRMAKCDVRDDNLYAKFVNIYLELLERKQWLEFILSASFVDDGEVIRVIDLYFAFVFEQKEKAKNTSCH